jgi:uncharacterized protein YdaU (DUF1376 family)
MKFYQRHLGDYARDTAHLSLLEHGVYSVLLDRLYATERPIPDADRYRICRATTRAERAAVDAVLREFFQSCDEGWTNGRVNSEIARYRVKCLKAQGSAAVRWSSDPMRTHSDRIADGMLSMNHEPRGHSKSPLSQPLTSPEGGGLVTAKEVLKKLNRRKPNGR